MVGFPFDSRLSYDAETGDPVYDRAVSSEPLRDLIKQLFTTGVMPNPSTCYQVSASTGMMINIAAGFAVVDGGLCEEPNETTLSVSASDNTYPRIDSVVLQWNENIDVREPSLYVKEGTASANPVRPTLTRTSSVYEIGLADILIPSRSTAVINDNITDTRMESARCGIVSSVSQWDTTTIYQQIQSELAEFKADEETDFADWFERMKEQLSEDAAGHLQNEIDEINAKPIPSYIGMVITSTVLDTEAKVQEIYGTDTFWIQHSGYVLKGATSGVTPDRNIKDAGNDTHTLTAAEMPTHRHSIPALSGTAASAGSHNHNSVYAKQAINTSSTGGGYGVPTFNTATTLNIMTSTNGSHTHSVTTNASNTGYTGSGTAIDIRQNEKNVYIWERVDRTFITDEDLNHV